MPSADTSRPVNGLRLGPSIALAVAVSCSVAIAACGGSGSGSAPGVGGVTTATGNSSPVALSRCMRAHGLTNFPDPKQGSGGAGQRAVHAQARRPQLPRPDVPRRRRGRDQRRARSRPSVTGVPARPEDLRVGPLSRWPRNGTTHAATSVPRHMTNRAAAQLGGTVEDRKVTTSCGRIAATRSRSIGQLSKRASGWVRRAARRRQEASAGGGRR